MIVSVAMCVFLVCVGAGAQPVHENENYLNDNLREYLLLKRLFVNIFGRESELAPIPAPSKKMCLNLGDPSCYHGNVNGNGEDSTYLSSGYNPGK